MSQPNKARLNAILTEEFIKSSNQHSEEMRSNMIKDLEEIRKRIHEKILKELL